MTWAAKLGLGLAVLWADLSRAVPPELDVPLRLWTDAAHPTGFVLGETTGVSWGDFDSDGFPDLFACQSALLWRNVGGVTWQLAANLGSVLPPAELRYGSSFADFDNDGRLDLATAPRTGTWGDNRLHLLRNLGNALFVDIAGDPARVDVQPYGNSETLCWADVDADRNLDLFVPVYPAWAGGPGNFFLRNTGLHAEGSVGFLEASAAARVDNLVGTARPEGAQFCDVDFDGDVDLYSNGTLYQNIWSTSPGRFLPLRAAASGVGLLQALDEGAMFFDYDLDGDPDLVVVYVSFGIRIWENRGDGTFFAPEAGIIDSPLEGTYLGMSAEDWDNDGDIDLTTKQVFRRNLLLEEGRRHFGVATSSIPPEHCENATPAWADWDHDGDLDCALGNWGTEGHLYENFTYTPATPAAAKRHVRVRAVRDSASVPRGLEVEYGAAVELRVLDPADGLARRKFVASSHGYLNQNEYTLHFVLPPDPAPADPERDVRFDVVVDFPGTPELGLWRVDRHVNPVLGNVQLAALTEREIVVYRCGRVVMNGVVYEPLPRAAIRLTTTSQGLALPVTTALPAPVPTTGDDAYVGVAFDTHRATRPLRLVEIVLDAQVEPAWCGSVQAPAAIWDVTNPAHPRIVGGSRIDAATSPRNLRSRIPFDAVLAPGRDYRIVARATEFRESPIATPALDGPITVLGGLAFRDASPCDGHQAALAPLRPTATAMAIRVRPDNDPAFDAVGSSLRVDRSPSGDPVLRWTAAGAAGFEVGSCDATSGPCAPAARAVLTTTTWLDAQPGPSLTWYRVEAAGDCELEQLPPTAGEIP